MLKGRGDHPNSEQRRVQADYYFKRKNQRIPDREDFSIARFDQNSRRK